jgi:outer membrane protein assembly factor BamD (BamD/ComL family)
MAMLRLGLETRQPLEQRAALLQKAHEQDPNSSDGERALFQLGFMYYAHKKPRESMDALTRFVRRYPHRKGSRLDIIQYGIDNVFCFV